jgi:hypothetical protein
MLKQPMIEKLAAMRLLGMVEALKTQEQDPSARELSFLERFGLLVDQQWNWRENQALSRRLKNAKLRTPNACVEEIDYRTARGLDKSVIRSLAQQSAWVGTHENIFVLGPTGVGKSFVACALAQKACRDGYSALYTRAQSLFRDLAMARQVSRCSAQHPLLTYLRFGINVGAYINARVSHLAESQRTSLEDAPASAAAVKYCPAHELLGSEVSKWQTLERHQYRAGLRLQSAVELSIVGIGARGGSWRNV